MTDLPDTPLLDQLEDGPWPSFVTDLKGLAPGKPAVAQLLGQLEKSYRDRWYYWTGTVHNLKGYGRGLLARYSALGDMSREVARCHPDRFTAPPV